MEQILAKDKFKTRLGHAEDLILKQDDLKIQDGKEVIFKHLDILDTALILRFFAFKDQKLQDLYFVRIDDYNFKDKRNCLYVKENDGSWKMEENFEIYPFEAYHKDYHIQNLPELKNIDLNKINEEIFQQHIDEKIFNNIKEGHEFYDQNLAVVKGELDFGFVDTIQAHINFFYTHHQLKSSRFAKDYFNIGFKANLDEFSNTDRILKTYAGYINTPQTSFDDVLPEGITEKSIYQDILDAEIKDDLYTDHDEAFTFAFLNYMMIYKSFYSATTGISIIKQYGKTLIETAFDYEDFYLRFILDEDSLINQYLLKDLKDVNEYERILSKLIPSAILALKNNEDLDSEAFINKLEAYHEDLRERKQNLRANHFDVMVKKLIPFDLIEKI